MLDDVERRRLLVEPAGEDPLPAPLRVAHVELDEGAGEGLHLPGSGGLAGAQPDDRVADPNRLAGLEGDRPGDSVALVDEPEHRDPLRHRSGAGSHGRHGLRDVDGARFRDRLGVGLGLPLAAAVAAGERGHGEEEDGAELEPHTWSGVQAS
jgi:hypothetical protein